MTELDTKFLQSMVDLDDHARQSEELLKRVVDWYNEKVLTGTFADIIADIRKHLETCSTNEQ